MNPAMLLALAALAQAAPGVPAGWKTYPSPRGAFSAALPARPTDTKRTATLGGAPVELTVLATRRGVASFSVASGELAALPTDPSRVLTEARDDVVRQARGKLLDEKAIDLQGHPGLEFRAEIPRTVVAGGATVRARVYRLDRRIFEVVTIQPVAPAPAQAQASAAEVDAFLASFRPNEVPAVVALPKPQPGPPAAPAATPVATRDWKEFRSERWGFAARFPTEPTVQSLPPQEPISPTPLEIFTSNSKLPICTLLCGEGLTLKGNDQRVAFIAGFRETVTKQGRIVNERNLSGGEAIARVITMEVGPPRLPVLMNVKILVVQVDQRYYSLTCSIPTDEGNLGGASDAFLDSFRLLNGKWPVGDPAAGAKGSAK